MERMKSIDSRGQRTILPAGKINGYYCVFYFLLNLLINNEEKPQKQIENNFPSIRRFSKNNLSRNHAD